MKDLFIPCPVLGRFQFKYRSATGWDVGAVLFAIRVVVYNTSKASRTVEVTGGVENQVRVRCYSVLCADAKNVQNFFGPNVTHSWRQLEDGAAAHHCTGPGTRSTAPLRSRAVKIASCVKNQAGGFKSIRTSGEAMQHSVCPRAACTWCQLENGTAPKSGSITGSAVKIARGITDHARERVSVCGGEVVKDSFRLRRRIAHHRQARGHHRQHHSSKIFSTSHRHSSTESSSCN